VILVFDDAERLAIVDDPGKVFLGCAEWDCYVLGSEEPGSGSGGEDRRSECTC
jgi:hypothetical protein